MFSKLVEFIRTVVRKILPYKDITMAEKIESPLSAEMIEALDLWYDMYRDRAPWLKPTTVRSLNLPAMICSEIARQTLIEMQWNISGPTKEDSAEEVKSPRADYLRAEFEKLLKNLRNKLEQGCAAGGMTIKPYTKDGHIYFDWTMAWSLFPIAFGDDGDLTDCIFRDIYTEGKTVYTRLERHTVEGDNVRIRQRAFKSEIRDNLGTEVPLSSVAAWASLVPEVTVKNTEGQMFGWFKVPSANCVDVDCPMGVSVFAKATKVIEQADLQYSRLLWEFEGSELAIDVDPQVLRPTEKKVNGKVVKEMPKLNDRLFRGVDLGSDENYHVFNPNIRDESLLAGLNQLLVRIEDLCGLARGTLADVNQDARTATELRIIKQRTYSTIKDTQDALERCLRDVIRAMDKYATIYELAPAGEYEASFEWDDSIITDSSLQLQERLELYAHNLIGGPEMRQWYFGETEAQAEAALQKIRDEEPDIKDLIPTGNNNDEGITSSGKKKSPTEK